MLKKSIVITQFRDEHHYRLMYGDMEALFLTLGEALGVVAALAMQEDKGDRRELKLLRPMKYDRK